jgi:hypothetical protein
MNERGKCDIFFTVEYYSAFSKKNPVIFNSINQAGVKMLHEINPAKNDKNYMISPFVYSKQVDLT